MGNMIFVFKRLGLLDKYRAECEEDEPSRMVFKGTSILAFAKLV